MKKTSFLYPVAAVFLLASCTSNKTTKSTSVLRSDTVYAVTAANQLVSFNAGIPEKFLTSIPLTGLQPNESISGIDFRIAKGVLYALGTSGRLYRVNIGSGLLQAVVNEPFANRPSDAEVGFDFNPAVDRIRIVNNTGLNMRAHPDTGALVDSDVNTPGSQTDGLLVYAANDKQTGRKPSIVAAAYTYNKDDEKVTTNYAIDANHAALVTQGTREGKFPAVSPNTGQLYTVGALGVEPGTKTSFDIADVSGAAYMSTVPTGSPASSWYEINLENGRATLIGKIAGNQPIVGIAVAP